MLCAYHIIDKSESPFMTQKTNLSLGNDFPDANKKDWLDAVEKALRGAAYESLQSRHNGLSREPLYTNETVKLSKSAHGILCSDMSTGFYNNAVYWVEVSRIQPNPFQRNRPVRSA